MSFRSVSILPTCLYGSIAARALVLRCGSVTCPRCIHNFVPARVGSSNEEHGHARIVNPLITSSLPHTRMEQDSLSSTQNLRTELRSRSKGAPTARITFEPSTTNRSSTNRVGQPLEIPDFILQAHSQTTSDAKLEKDVTKITRKIKQSQAEVVEGYPEWEEINDRFIHVCRTDRARMAEIFSDERKLASNFIDGDIHSEECTSKFHYKWKMLASRKKDKLLPILLIGSLAESAAQALFVLTNITYMRMRFRIRMNCLRAVSITYEKDLELNPELKQTYENLIEQLRYPEIWPKDRMPAVLLQNLLYSSTPDQCQKIIRRFFEKYQVMDNACTLAIIDHFVRIEDPGEAFEYIRSLPIEYLRQSDATFKSLRDRFIKLDVVEKGRTGTNFKYLPKLLALGLTPDEELHNAVIESAILNEIPDVAWDVYQYLEDSQYQTNARSHLVLLRDAFLRKNLQRVNEIMTKIHQREDLVRDKYLMAYAMNIVRNISRYEEDLSPHEALSHLMALYDRAYDRAPLANLRIVPAIDGASPLPEPTPTLLAFTIWSYILVQRRDSVVGRLWEWIKHLISSGDKSIIEAAKYDVFYNGLILYHARNATTLMRALDVVEYMLSSQLCLPSARTWSILLCSFLRHGQVERAEKILTLMRARRFPVETIFEQYSSYVPPGYDLQSIAQHIYQQDSDERVLPGGMEDWLAESDSLRGEQDLTLRDQDSSSTVGRIG